MADSGTGGGGGGDVEAAKDPGALKSHSSITDAEMMGKEELILSHPCPRDMGNYAAQGRIVGDPP